MIVGNIGNAFVQVFDHIAIGIVEMTTGIAIFKAIGVLVI
jgi:hypothetical protein